MSKKDRAKRLMRNRQKRNLDKMWRGGICPRGDLWAGGNDPFIERCRDEVLSGKACQSVLDFFIYSDESKNLKPPWEYSSYEIVHMASRYVSYLSALPFEGDRTEIRISPFCYSVAADQIGDEGRYFLEYMAYQETWHKTKQSYLDEFMKHYFDRVNYLHLIDDLMRLTNLSVIRRGLDDNDKRYYEFEDVTKWHVRLDDKVYTVKDIPDDGSFYSPLIVSYPLPTLDETATIVEYIGNGFRLDEPTHSIDALEYPAALALKDYIYQIEQYYEGSVPSRSKYIECYQDRDNKEDRLIADLDRAINGLERMNIIRTIKTDDDIYFQLLPLDAERQPFMPKQRPLETDEDFRAEVIDHYFFDRPDQVKQAFCKLEWLLEKKSRNELLGVDMEIYRDQVITIGQQLYFDGKENGHDYMLDVCRAMKTLYSDAGIFIEYAWDGIGEWVT